VFFSIQLPASSSGLPDNKATRRSGANMEEEFVPLTIQQYSREALATDRRQDITSLNFPLLGLFGEIGTLLSAVKKKQRDSTAFRAYAEAVTEELGDALWYLNLVACKGGITLADVVTNLRQDNADWLQATDAVLTFDALQPAVIEFKKTPSVEFERTLTQLAAAVGKLMHAQDEKELIKDKKRLGPCLVTVLDTLVNAATEAGVTLEAAAIKNLKKTSDRWPVHKSYPRFFDEDAPWQEQLPRFLEIDISEREVGGKLYVFQRCNSLNIGDRLTDNAMAPDDYRFHDVFHYAYVAVLGWSPVTRSLFKLKRKSMPQLDEVQDGARAALIEEGITTWIFGQAVELNLFASHKAGDLPFDLLKQVRQFVAGYEAEECPAWLWEEAILQGYAVFRYLREHRRGKVTIDAENRKISVEAVS
jgi:NTP pyrophosphatase (non-canonical NTP hydrolase)